jgi:hypothetical protein
MNDLGPGSRICCEHFAQIFGTDVVDAVVSQVYMANRQIGPQAASAAIFQWLWHQHLSGFMNCVKRSKLGTQSI